MRRKLGPSEMPAWPRRLSLALAAAYLGISPSKLSEGAGKAYPAPIRDGRNVLWDRRALDAYVDGAAEAGAGSGLDPVMERIRERRKAQARQRGAA